MSDFKVGYPVEVIPLRQIRKIVQIDGQRALCERMPKGEKDWFSFDQLRPHNSGPMRATF